MRIPQFFEQIRKNYWAQIAGCFVFFLIIFSSYFLLPSFNSADDQFFNIRLAEKLSTEGINALTYFDEFSYGGAQSWVFNPLFYIVLIPFTWIEPLEYGIKLFAVTAVAGLLTALFLYFRTRLVPQPFIWTCIICSLLLNADLYMHILNARAFVLALFVLVLLFIVLLKKRYEWVAVVSFLYFFVHSATFFFPVLVGAIYTAFLLQGRFKNAWNPVLATGVGMVAASGIAILIFPDFVTYFLSFLETLSKIVLSFHSVGATEISEGLESYPMTIFDIFAAYPLFSIFVVTILGIQGQRMWDKYQNKKSIGEPLDITLFFLTILFLLGTLITKRNLDFFFLFALLYTVPVASQWFEDNKQAISVTAKRSFLAVIALLMITQIFVFADRIVSAPWYQSIESAALWLQENTEENSIVYNPTMNFFATFYFYNEGHNRVVIGIEPRNFYDHDPEKYWKWVNLSERGVICSQDLCPIEMKKRDMAKAQENKAWLVETGEQAVAVLQNDFQTDTVITSGDFVYFNEILEESGKFEKVYETPVSGMYRIYQVKK